MPDRETTIIPLDDAHEILGTFGIGPRSQGYQRWRRDDGFRWVDLEDVLNESSAVLSVDWRDALQDALETVATQVGDIGISLGSDLDEEGEQASLEVDGKRVSVAYSADGDFDTVVRAINGLIADKAQYRKFRSSEGSDGWRYGLLTNEDWKSLETNAPKVTALLFLTG